MLGPSDSRNASMAEKDRWFRDEHSFSFIISLILMDDFHLQQFFPDARSSFQFQTYCRDIGRTCQPLLAGILGGDRAVLPPCFPIARISEPCPAVFEITCLLRSFGATERTIVVAGIPKIPSPAINSCILRFARHAELSRSKLQTKRKSLIHLLYLEDEASTSGLHAWRGDHRNLSAPN